MGVNRPDGESFADGAEDAGDDDRFSSDTDLEIIGKSGPADGSDIVTAVSEDAPSARLASCVSVGDNSGTCGIGGTGGT